MQKETRNKRPSLGQNYLLPEDTALMTKNTQADMFSEGLVNPSSEEFPNGDKWIRAYARTASRTSLPLRTTRRATVL